MSGDSTNTARLASLFYEGILSPEAWYAALTEVTREVGGSFFHQIVIDRSDMQVVANIASVDTLHRADEYARHYAASDERLKVLAGLRPGEFMFDFDHFDVRHRSRSPLYADFLASERVQSCVAIVLHRDGEVRDEVGILRGLDARPLSERERLLLRQLAPEMARAGRLRTQASVLAQQAALGFAALDSLPRALAIVDMQGRIEYCNMAAEHFFSINRECKTSGRRLRLSNTFANDRLCERIAAACAPMEPRPGILRVGQGERTVSISVLPLRPSHRLALGSVSRAIVLFAGPALVGATAMLPEDLAECLGTTRTEARLANMLACGASVNEFAVIQGCSLSTARSHLRSLLHKTGCRRQRDLMVIVQGLMGGA